MGAQDSMTHLVWKTRYNTGQHIWFKKHKAFKSKVFLRRTPNFTSWDKRPGMGMGGEAAAGPVAAVPDAEGTLGNVAAPTPKENIGGAPCARPGLAALP